MVAADDEVVDAMAESMTELKEIGAATSKQLEVVRACFGRSVCVCVCVCERVCLLAYLTFAYAQNICAYISTCVVGCDM